MLSDDYKNIGVGGSGDDAVPSPPPDRSPAVVFFFVVLQFAGPICFIGMQLSSLRTSYQIYATKSVGQLSNIPFLSLLTNSVVWTIYGYLKQDVTVFVPNYSGMLAGLACIGVYHRYADEVDWRNYAVSAVILVVAAILGYEGYVEYLGSLGVCMSIFLLGSPLSTLATVIRNKNTNALPFYTSLTTFMNALSWFLYGAIESKDPMIYVPNFVGLLLACVQLSLFALFGMPKGPDVALSDDLLLDDGLPSSHKLPPVRAYEVVGAVPTNATPLRAAKQTQRYTNA